MFIELAELLRCPAEHHEQSFCVVIPDQVLGRGVRAGVIGCPVCKREYPIFNGAVCFDDPPDTDEDESNAVLGADPDAVRALLGVTGPGGYVVLVGSAARLTDPLAGLLDGIHLVAVNPPRAIRSSSCSVLYSRDRIPLKDSMARGAVVGGDDDREHWIRESARVLLKGLRLVALSEDVRVEGVEELAVGDGMWVGRKE